MEIGSKYFVNESLGVTKRCAHLIPLWCWDSRLLASPLQSIYHIL